MHRQCWTRFVLFAFIVDIGPACLYATRKMNNILFSFLSLRILGEIKRKVWRKGLRRRRKKGLHFTKCICKCGCKRKQGRVVAIAQVDCLSFLSFFFPLPSILSSSITLTTKRTLLSLDEYILCIRPWICSHFLRRIHSLCPNYILDQLVSYYVFVRQFLTIPQFKTSCIKRPPVPQPFLPFLLVALHLFLPFPTSSSSLFLPSFLSLSSYTRTSQPCTLPSLSLLP